MGITHRIAYLRLKGGQDLALTAQAEYRPGGATARSDTLSAFGQKQTSVFRGSVSDEAKWVTAQG